jgi:hypothetical protein
MNDAVLTNWRRVTFWEDMVALGAFRDWDIPGGRSAMAARRYHDNASAIRASIFK